MSDKDIHDLFCRLRWGSQTHQACPGCGAWDNHYVLPNRQQWRCKACRRQFSVTSATMFASHKKSLRTIAILAFYFVTSVKGVAGVHLCRLSNYSNKGANIMIGKFREALMRSQDLRPLAGTVHIDGGYFGGKPRKPNRRGRRNNQLIADRISGNATGRRKPWHATGTTRSNWERRVKDRRVVMTLRETGDIGKGAVRSISVVALAESGPVVTELIRRYVSPCATIMTDENTAYAMVSATNDHFTVNHQVEWSTPEGVNENQAESYFSRLRRWEYGIGHGIRKTYLADLSCEMAWREDVRRRTIGQKFEELLTKGLTTGYSRWWRGYYQGKHRGTEILMNEGLDQATS
ncbi:IS1595 family transposase [Luteimonas panaciterrae]|uniref:IS1595 family transposase n=1 Tax=Luteimonas panaciterrae TaxID=363885 RepID=UPI001CF94318|nr:IS1595 family transposase [Luteimonas panaciterrae]